MRRLLMVGLMAAALAACSGSEGSGNGDGGTVNGNDAGSDAGSGNDGGTHSGTDAGTDGGSSGNVGWHVITPNDEFASSSAYIYGVYCTAVDKCVLAAGGSLDRGGGVWAIDGDAWGELLLDGDYEDGPLSNLAGVLGDLDLTGFVKTRTGVVAKVTTSGLYLSATGDVTQASSWSAVKAGTVVDGSFGGNAVLTYQSSSDTEWLFANNDGYVYTAAQAPSETTSWTRVWGPTATPPVPADFVTQFSADHTLCDWDISTSAQPFPAQSFYASPDLGIVMHPAYGLNQDSWRDLNNETANYGELKAGVCISTDKGLHFHFAELPGATELEVSSPGPFGVTCVDNDHCFAFNGTSFQENSYIYYSDNATAGKDSTWTKATVPAAWATSEEISVAAVFFAPDKVHGWAVGNNARDPMLLRTTDSGHTWVDISGQVASLADSDLVGGFALDKDHLWVTGRYGFIGATDTAQN